ncbi:unnamed protein product [Ambrosiozyma monospora]|uniref:Unnamed protein product n=1 Tax=Ambrosiozyma monospora TaxID=43982 RepID=A0ACB5T729_AMBMO|nr:unnamed protein product [Ambrosiozyma monospora]
MSQYKTVVKSSQRLETMYSQRQKATNEALVTLVTAAKEHGQQTSVVLSECEDVLKQLNRNESLMSKLKSKIEARKHGEHIDVEEEAELADSVLKGDIDTEIKPSSGADESNTTADSSSEAANSTANTSPLSLSDVNGQSSKRSSSEISISPATAGSSETGAGHTKSNSQDSNGNMVRRKSQQNHTRNSSKRLSLSFLPTPPPSTLDGSWEQVDYAAAAAAVMDNNTNGLSMNNINLQYQAAYNYQQSHSQVSTPTNGEFFNNNNNSNNNINTPQMNNAHQPQFDSALHLDISKARRTFSENINNSHKRGNSENLSRNGSVLRSFSTGQHRGGLQRNGSYRRNNNGNNNNNGHRRQNSKRNSWVSGGDYINGLDFQNANFSPAGQYQANFNNNYNNNQNNNYSNDTNSNNGDGNSYQNHRRSDSFRYNNNSNRGRGGRNNSNRNSGGNKSRRQSRNFEDGNQSQQQQPQQQQQQVPQQYVAAQSGI